MTRERTRARLIAYLAISGLAIVAVVAAGGPSWVVAAVAATVGAQIGYAIAAIQPEPQDRKSVV